MRIQQINEYNPNLKSLYFTKSPVLFNDTIKFSENLVDPKTVKRSKNGFRYIEDNIIKPELAERIKNAPFVKKLSEKFDTFVHYFGVHGEENDKFAFMDIHIANPKRSYAEKYVIFGRGGNSAQKAEEACLTNLENNKFLITPGFVYEV